MAAEDNEEKKWDATGEYRFSIEQKYFDELMENNGVTSQNFKINGVLFYVQINRRVSNESGLISLLLLRFGKAYRGKTVTISGEFFCESMDEYSVPFDSQTLMLGGSDVDSRVSVPFEWDSFVKACKEKQCKGQCVDWLISVAIQPKVND